MISQKFIDHLEKSLARNTKAADIVEVVFAGEAVSFKATDHLFLELLVVHAVIGQMLGAYLKFC